MPAVSRFRDWFWRPPRAHGDVVRDRVVSPVELLYDLVYVAVIFQAAHQLALEVSTARVLEFALVFAMIWLAWVNGSLFSSSTVATTAERARPSSSRSRSCACLRCSLRVRPRPTARRSPSSTPRSST